MRTVIFATLLAFTGCGPGQFFSAEKIAERNAAAAREQEARQAYLDSPAGQADMVCSYRAQAATAGRRAGLIDLEGAVIAANLRNTCMDIFYKTGTVP